MEYNGLQGRLQGRCAPFNTIILFMQEDDMAKEPEQVKPESGFRAFLKRKNVDISFKRYGIDALSAMALGLFASLLIGTIMSTLGQQLTNAFGSNELFNVLIETGKFASQATGPSMAVSIGYALQAPPLVMFTLAGVGVAANSLGGAGGPLAVLIIAILACEVGKIVSKETKVDIIVTPFVTMFVGGLLAMWMAPAIGSAASAVGEAIMWATERQPFVMGVLVSVIVGVALTLPISSAAICAALGLVGLAGGAAVAGCSAQMVGFAVMSFKENKWGGLVAQGIGTSMLQMGNILRNPRIWIPPTLASAVTGPIATMVFKLQMNGAPLSSGMGTSGLVGQIGVITGWFTPSEIAVAQGAVATAPGAWDWLGLILISFVLPAILTVLFAMPLYKKGWIKEGDLKLDL